MSHHFLRVIIRHTPAGSLLSKPKRNIITVDIRLATARTPLAQPMRLATATSLFFSERIPRVHFGRIGASARRRPTREGIGPRQPSCPEPKPPKKSSRHETNKVSCTDSATDCAVSHHQRWSTAICLARALRCFRGCGISVIPQRHASPWLASIAPRCFERLCLRAPTARGELNIKRGPAWQTLSQVGNHIRSIAWGFRI